MTGALRLDAPTPVAPAAPLTILHLVAPGAAGGLESVVRLLAAGHARRGHAVHVAAVLDPGAPDEHPWLDALRAAGVAVTPLRPGARGYLRERAAVAALCRRLAPAVAHSHGYRSDVIAAAGARAAGVPTVTTVHGFTGVGGWKGRLYEWMQLRAFRRFDAVVSVSRPIVERLAASGVERGRIHLLPNAHAAAAPRRTREAARRALGLPDDALVVGWVGRLSHEKGADVLLDALALVRDPRVVVSLVGEGRERAALEARVAALGLAGRVRFHGLVPDAGGLLPAFDVVTLSSRTEGTPIVLLEAMAAGVPVVATRVGGVPDVVGDDEASLVPPERPDLLAAAIATVARDPAAGAARAALARRRLDAAHAVEPWLDRHESLYRSLAPASRLTR